VFDVAHFWHTDPAAICALSLARFDTYLAQAERIAHKSKPSE